MQHITLKPMTPSPEAIDRRQAQDVRILSLIAALLIVWAGLGFAGALASAQRVADLQERV